MAWNYLSSLFACLSSFLLFPPSLSIDVTRNNAREVHDARQNERQHLISLYIYPQVCIRYTVGLYSVCIRYVFGMHSVCIRRGFGNQNDRYFLNFEIRGAVGAHSVCIRFAFGDCHRHRTECRPREKSRKKVVKNRASGARMRAESTSVRIRCQFGYV